MVAWSYHRDRVQDQCHSKSNCHHVQAGSLEKRFTEDPEQSGLYAQMHDLCMQS